MTTVLEQKGMPALILLLNYPNFRVFLPFPVLWEHLARPQTPPGSFSLLSGQKSSFGRGFFGPCRALWSCHPSQGFTTTPRPRSGPRSQLSLPSVPQFPTLHQPHPGRAGALKAAPIPSRCAEAGAATRITAPRGNLGTFIVDHSKGKRGGKKARAFRAYQWSV